MTHSGVRQQVVDVLLGVVLVTAAVVGAADTAAVPHPLAEIVAGVWVSFVALRTRAPFVMVVGWSAGAACCALLAPTTGLAGFVAILIVSFSAGLSLSGRARNGGLVMLVASTYLLQVATAHRPGAHLSLADTYVTPAVLILGPALGGMLLARSRRQTAEVQRLGAELAAEREAHVRAAAAAERNRIARELHDVISHSVSVMVVQAGAAELQLSGHSPVHEQLQAIRRTGKEALAELRHQLGVLREIPEDRPVPIPVLADLPQLVHQSGATLQYDADVVGEVSPGVALTAYRLVQECLTNARRHAAGSTVMVCLDRRENRLSVDVVNGPGRELDEHHPQGHGLIGMSERLAMYAGRLESGATSDGGWRVHASLPVTAEANAS
jgi:signal transduction histidine kinase